MKTNGYLEFLKSKRLVFERRGREIDESEISEALFPFQRRLTWWALRKGRCAIFADTGLGKTVMQVEWARLITDGSTLIVAPLNVAQQTVREAEKILGVDIRYSRDGAMEHGITITNYEHVEKFRAADFDAIVLDESSILKSIDGKTKAKLIRQFSETPYRLCCTATPAPNDITEIANHAEFLGIMTRADMLGAFFVHKSGGPGDVARWYLKGHAEEPFFRWLASWGMSVKKPSDIGFLDSGYNLPELKVDPVFVKTGYKPKGELFFTELKGITDRIDVRKKTLKQRVRRAVKIAKDANGQVIVWCGLNEESAMVASRLGDDAVEIKGSDSADRKVDAIRAFQEGDIRVLVTKPRIAGFGMNFQNAADQVFVGLSDSFEAYYQCIRRSWRFGQTKPVTARIVLSDCESAIFDNVRRKEREAERMSRELIKNVAKYEREELEDVNMDFEYKERDVSENTYRLILGDSCEKLKGLDDESVDLSVYSPPFITLYAYTNTERDLGNSGSAEEFFEHYRYVITDILRLTKPGRHTCVHCAQVPRTKQSDGWIGLRDFRGELIHEYTKAGWIYHGEICIDKCPQAQAIRTKNKGLLFVTKEKDSSWLRQALADYILVFRKPGENAVPIQNDVTNDEWIEWARPVWYGIKETDVLKTAEGKAEKDEKHICPLQIGTIERCIRLWSNEGETILSPFMGIGSEGYVAVKWNRRFVGVELKESYFEAAVRNIKTAWRQKNEKEKQLNIV